MLSAVLWQPVCSRAWQRSQIPWPGPRPQVHLRIPGAVTLIPAFHRARAATRHQIKNKRQTHVFCFRDKCKQRCFAFATTKFCRLQRIPYISSDTHCSLLFLPCSCASCSYRPSFSMPQRKKQEQSISIPKPWHPGGNSGACIGILRTCMKKSPDGQGLYLIQSGRSCQAQNYQ